MPGKVLVFAWAYSCPPPSIAYLAAIKQFALVRKSLRPQLSALDLLAKPILETNGSVHVDSVLVRSSIDELPCFIVIIADKQDRLV